MNPMLTLLLDFRFAIRQLRKNPGFAAATVLTLALGIGATTAIFSLVNAVLLRPLPFPQHDRLVWLQQADQTLGPKANVSEPLSYPDFFDWRAQNRSFEGIACYHRSNTTLSGSGEPRHLDRSVVSAEFFRVLGVRPILGRDFLAEDEKPGARVVMLSHQLWQTNFSASRDIVGQSIILDGRSYTVAGVVPQSFVFPIENPPPLLWTTMADDDQAFSQRGSDRLDVIGRLKPGISLEQARAEMSVIAHRIAVEYPDTNKPYTAAIAQPELEHLIGDSRPALRLLFAAVGLVLLIACANVAGLLLGRGSSRRSELALRAALGASRTGIIRQILVESVTLSILGGALGVLLSTWILTALVRFVPKDLPRLDQISVDSGVLVFATGVSILTGLLFGVLPAWRASQLDPLTALREGGRSVTAGRSQHRLQNWLVIGETALGLVLLMGSGLLIRSFVRVLQVDPGFDPKHVLSASLTLPESQYPDAKKIEFYKLLLPRLAALPGVQSVAAGFPLPLLAGNIGVSFAIEGHPTPPGDAPSEQLAVITPDFFHTMRIPVLSGREFSWRDDHKGKPVIIVNERFAQKYFPGENAVGKHMKSDLGDGTMEAPMREVVAVVGDVKRKGLTAEADPIYYLPWTQAVITSPALCIRTAGDPASLIAPLRTTLAELDKGIPIYREGTLENAVYRAAAQPRFYAILVTSFAALALLLSAVGLYAVLSYVVVQRTAEIGVRMALGAQRADVLGSILKRGFTLASAGIAIGLGASAVLTRYMAGMLFNVRPFDIGTFLAVTAIFLLVSLAASVAPAYRAARLDPMTTLRDQ
jgi:putative ABC transport system permease protein